MRVFGLTGNNPYMASSRGLANPRPELLAGTRYQIVPSAHGTPMAQVELTFQRNLPALQNPDMTLAVLLDRSGSMFETYNDGHVYNVAATIYNHVAAAGVGYDLLFYSDGVTDAGPMNSLGDVRLAVQDNPPDGGTRVTQAIRTAIRKYRTRRGLYLIVITDGEFADKTQVLNLVVQDLLPQLTPDNPYAFRLHFVGAGEGVDHEFLRQLEAAAVGQGAQLVTQHHHAHLSHSHASILDELDKALLGVGTDARFGDPRAIHGAANLEDPTVLSAMDVATRRTWEGPVGTLGFLPRRTVLGCGYPELHSGHLDISIQYQNAESRQQNLTVTVPLPSVAAAAAPSAPRTSTPRFQLPWLHRTPADEAARADAARQREILAERQAKDRGDAQRRQTHDLAALARGGLPQEATDRLREIGATDADAVLFTSDLSPEEAGLLRREGYRPRGLVTGSAMYHVGQAYASTQGDCEVTVLSEAYDTATALAVSRMRQELQLIGAHGVVGVRLNLVRHEWADKTIEVQVLGTAVEGPGSPPADPWMCDLSGQEWWALHRAGYEPATLVWGHCTWFILTTYQDELIKNSWINQELTHWSQALSTARHRALATLINQARQHRATGVAGVRFERRLDEVRLTGPGEDPTYEREHHNLVVSIVGTGIRVRPGAPKGVRPTINVLSLRDGRIAPVALGAADATFE